MVGTGITEKRAVAIIALVVVVGLAGLFYQVSKLDELKEQQKRELYSYFIENYCIKNAPTGAFYVTYASTTAVFLESKDRVEVVRVCE